MNREFQAVYRVRTLGAPIGEVKTVNIIAEGKDQVTGMLEGAGLVMVGVTQIRAVVDWDKPVWDLDEFAAAMSIKGGTLSSKKGDGRIPWNSTVSGVPRRVAMKWIEDGLNPAGKEILEELKKEHLK